MAVVQIRKNPADMQNILDKFYTSQQPEISEEETTMIEGVGPVPPGPTPTIQQALGMVQ